MSLSDEIKKAREGMKIDRTPSISELAELLNVTPSYLYKLESGDLKSASVSFLKSYAEKTGVPIEKFITQIGE